MTHVFTPQRPGRPVGKADPPRPSTRPQGDPQTSPEARESNLSAAEAGAAHTTGASPETEQALAAAQDREARARDRAATRVQAALPSHANKADALAALTRYAAHLNGRDRLTASRAVGALAREPRGAAPRARTRKADTSPSSSDVLDALRDSLTAALAVHSEIRKADAAALRSEIAEARARLEPAPASVRVRTTRR